MFDDVKTQLDVIEHDNGEGYRTSYELRRTYRQAGEEWHETIEEDLTMGDLWSRLYKFHRMIATRGDSEKLADWHREKLGVDDGE